MAATVIKQQLEDGAISIKLRVGNRLLNLTREPLPADTDCAGFRQDIIDAPLLPYVAPPTEE